MRLLLIYCHPLADSFTAAVRDTAMSALQEGGHEVRLLDLYGMDFQPVLSADERRDYHTPGDNERAVADHIAHLRWCEGLLFVYPTWWYGQPAMLKGWLDRVWVPFVTFDLPEAGGAIKPLMTHIRFVGAVTTCGANRWWLALMGNPGRRTLLRGIRALCAKGCKTLWLAHYSIDSSTAQSRGKFLEKVAATLRRLKGSYR